MTEGHERRVRRVALNTASMLAGEAGVKLLGAVFSIFVVRHLGADDFGRYSAAIAFVTLFSVLTDIGTSTLSVREMARLPRQAAAMLADLIGLRLVLSIAALFFIPAAARGLGESSELVSAIQLGSFTLILYACGGPIQAYLIARERLDVVSLANVLNQASFIALGSIALLLRGGFIGLIVAALAALAISSAVSAVLAQRRLDLDFVRPSPLRWPALLRGGLPFFVQQISDTSMRRFDVVYLLFALDATHVGWYSVAFGLPMMVLPLAQSLGLALFPSLVREHASGAGSIRPTVQRAVRYVLLASLPMAIGGCLLADRIIRVLYTDAFAPSAPALRVLVWSLPPLFLSEILGRASSTLHLEARQARISIVTAMLSVVLVVGGVAAFGIVGAAVAFVLTRCYVVVATLRLIDPALVLDGNSGRLLRIGLAAVIMAAGVGSLLLAPGALPASPALSLIALIGAGAALYASAVLLLRVLAPEERRFLAESAVAALRRLAPGS